jgi:hypothetical protein
MIFVEEGGENSYENLIALCPNCHRMVHRGLIDRKSVRIYKANLRFLHDKYSQLETDILFELAAAGEGARIPWMPYLTILVKRSLESGFLDLQRHRSVNITMGGIDTTPTFILITPKGRQFVADLGDHEL